MSDLEDGEVVEAKQEGKLKKISIKSNNYRTKVCEHFKKGLCKNGANCSFQHPKELQYVRICKYFLGNSCQNQQCQFSHDISKYQCKFFFISNNCNQRECKFSHDQWENDLQRTQWYADNEQYRRDYLSKKVFEDQKRVQPPQIINIFNNIRPPTQQQQFENQQFEKISDSEEGEISALKTSLSDPDQSSDLPSLKEQQKQQIKPIKKEKKIRKFIKTNKKKQKKTIIYSLPIRKTPIEYFLL
ncbi:hypothetical protein pb186bvf_001004 [Paramecium bursaria]